MLGMEIVWEKEYISLSVSYCPVDDKSGGNMACINISEIEGGWRREHGR
jgi:hypothetical protein